MTDILKKYKKHKLLSNINIVIASLVLAIWINFFLVDWTDIGKNLKTSVLDSETNIEYKSDIYLEKTNNTISIYTSKKLEATENISFSIVYNPGNIEIQEVNSNFTKTELNNTPGISSIILDTGWSIDIEKNTKIANIYFNKKEEKTENVNIINANFKDKSWEIYLLSTSWITF